MSKNECHDEILRTVQETLIPYLPMPDIAKVTDTLTKALAVYSISKKSTEIVPYDDENQRLLKRYCACLMIGGKSKRTIVAYSQTIKKLCEFLGMKLTEVGTYDIRYFLACMKENGVSDRSLENARANLSAFYQWLTLEEIINKNPCMKIAPIKYADKVRYPFSSVEIDSLRSACTCNRDRAMMELLLSSGVRVGELAKMKVTDIDFAHLSIHVYHGKGNKERTVYINDVCKAYLQKYLMSRTETGDVLFYGKKHTILTDSGIRKILHQLGDAAGVTDVHPHRFRRTFATNLSKRGMDIQEIRKLMGHTNINTTLAYIYTDDQQTQSLYRKHTA